ncbi:GTPase [Saccharopolyspora taberi]|uniref:G domain-containing protein n=1 Tax=Saccharopolyspora taberi TaxID=60895 RepID=A0ABN3VH06_9PSEU
MSIPRLLSATYVAVAFGSVMGAGVLLGLSGQAVIALAFVAAALCTAGFGPVQRLAARMARSRAAPPEGLPAVAGEVSAVGSLEQALPTLARMLAEGTGAAHASLWLTAGERLVSAASWPSRWAGSTHAVADLDALRALPGVDHAVPVIDAHLRRGALAIGKPGPVTERDLRFMHNIAGGAGLLLRSVALNTELRARVQQAEELGTELSESKQRLVHARDVERRRLVTEITAVTAGSLAEIRTELDQLKQLVDTDPTAAQPVLARLRPRLDEVIERFRAVVRGVYPGVLRDEGPRAALEELASDLPRPVLLTGHFGDRVDWETESGIYFAAAAAMRLFGREPSTVPLKVHIGHERGRLTARIEETGPLAADPNTALADDEDRLAALGGGLRCRATTAGVTVTAWLPDRLEPTVPEPSETPAETVAEEPVEPRPELAPTGIGARVRTLLDAAMAHFGTAPAGAVLSDLARRLDEPPRVAVAGRTGAGKSTLVNALAGQELADPGSTLATTWYRGADRPSVTLHPRDGEPRGLTTTAGLGGLQPEQVDHVVVGSRSPALHGLSLIDLPPVDSVDTAVAERVLKQLISTHLSIADIVVYLAREFDAADADLLAQIDRRSAAVAVLCHADELGGCGRDALQRARQAAEQHFRDPRFRRSCQEVLPVAALLGASGATLREPEFHAFERLGALPREQTDDLLGSAERFTGRVPLPDLGSAQRAGLLGRFGLFGVRLATDLVRDGVGSRAVLSAELVRASGLPPLRDLLSGPLADRTEVVKARSALREVDVLLRSAAAGDPQLGALAYELDRIRSGAHEFVELDVLDGLRRRPPQLSPEDISAARRLLGAAGTDPRLRLGLDAGAGAGDVEQTAARQLARWQMRAENPASSREVRELSLTVVRTCEGLMRRTGVTTG